MNKNRIGGRRQWTNEHMVAKSISIKTAEGISGGCVSKAGGLTLGDLIDVAALAVETTPRLSRWQRR